MWTMLVSAIWVVLVFIVGGEVRTEVLELPVAEGGVVAKSEVDALVREIERIVVETEDEGEEVLLKTEDEGEEVLLETDEGVCGKGCHIGFEGEGDSVEHMIVFQEGNYVVEATYTGDRYTTIVLQGLVTDDSETLFSDYGCAQTCTEKLFLRIGGNSFMATPPGEYLLEVDAEGTWHVEIVAIE